MTVQNFSRFAARVELSPQQALALVACSTSVVLVDARSLSSYSLEHVRGAVCQPLPEQLNRRYVLVYDAGATCLQQSFAHAVAFIDKYQQLVHPDTKFALICGGLPAIRELCPTQIVVDPNAATLLSRKVHNFPWAVKALQQVVHEADHPGSVLPWLYVGAAVHAYDMEMLQKEKFTHILVVGGELKAKFQHLFCYHHVRARDTAAYPLNQHFPTIVAFLHALSRRKDAKCLVHCFAGASRSVAAVVAFLIWKGMTFHQALNTVKECRRAAQPNHGFLKQLKEWEVEVRRGIHAQLPPVSELQLRVPTDEQHNQHQLVESPEPMLDVVSSPVRKPKAPTMPLAIPCNSLRMSPRIWDASIPLPYSPVTPQSGRQRCEEPSNECVLKTTKAVMRMSPPNHLSLPKAFNINGLSVDLPCTTNCRLTNTAPSLVQHWGEQMSDGEDATFVDLVNAEEGDCPSC